MCIRDSRLPVSATSFTQALLVTETNAPAGVEGTGTFVDDYALTGGPTNTNARFYRVKLVNP